MAKTPIRAMLARWPSYRELATDIHQLTRRPRPADIEALTDAARMWAHRDMIPARYWRRVVASAQARGFSDVTLERLAEIEERRL